MTVNTEYVIMLLRVTSKHFWYSQVTSSVKNNWIDAEPWEPAHVISDNINTLSSIPNWIQTLDANVTKDILQQPLYRTYFKI